MFDLGWLTLRVPDRVVAYGWGRDSIQLVHVKAGAGVHYKGAWSVKLNKLKYIRLLKEWSRNIDIINYRQDFVDKFHITQRFCADNVPVKDLIQPRYRFGFG